MKKTSDLSNNKNLQSIKNSAISAGIAVAVTLPLSAAFSGNLLGAANAAQTGSAGTTVACAAPATSALTAAQTAAKSATSTSTGNNSNNSGNNSGNTGGNGGGTGSTNTGSQNTGSTSADHDVVGVAASVPVNALNNDLNNSLNNVASGNTVNVLNGNNDVLSGILGTANSTLGSL